MKMIISCVSENDARTQLVEAEKDSYYEVEDIYRETAAEILRKSLCEIIVDDFRVSHARKSLSIRHMPDGTESRHSREWEPKSIYGARCIREAEIRRVQFDSKAGAGKNFSQVISFRRIKETQDFLRLDCREIDLLVDWSSSYMQRALVTMILQAQKHLVVEADSTNKEWLPRVGTHSDPRVYPEPISPENAQKWLNKAASLTEVAIRTAGELAASVLAGSGDILKEYNQRSLAVRLADEVWSYTPLSQFIEYLYQPRNLAKSVTVE